MTRLVLEVAKRAHALNQALFRDHPKGNLSPREVHHIAKSVAKWTYNRYQGARVYPVSSTGRPDRSRLSPQARALIPPLQGQGLQEAVREGGKRRGSRRRQEAEERLVEALKRLQSRNEAITARALAREAGVSPTTAANWLKRMRGQG
jgi:lambda repressor-like predicted transcriptional regulator